MHRAAVRSRAARSASVVLLSWRLGARIIVIRTDDPWYRNFLRRDLRRSARARRKRAREPDRLPDRPSSTFWWRGAGDCLARALAAPLSAREPRTRGRARDLDRYRADRGHFGAGIDRRTPRRRGRRTGPQF